MTVRRRSVRSAIALCGALAAAACGGTDDRSASETSTPRAPDTTSAPEDDSADEPETDGATATGEGENEPAAGDADERDAGATDTADQAAPSNGTRVVTHGLGETEIPVDPSRVYVADPGGLDAAIALDAAVIGATRWRDDVGVPPYVSAVAGREIPTPTDRFNPNYEAVLALDPDLIIVPDSADTTQYDLFSEIAPTVAYGADMGTGDRPSWNVIVEQLADFTGRTDRLDEVFSAYDADVERLRARIDDAGLSDATVAVVRPRSTIEFRLYRPVGLSAGDTLWADAGISYQDVPESIMADNGVWAPLSAERLDEVSAELVFIVLPAGQAETAAAELESNSIWTTLPAVENGTVCLVDGEASETAWFVVGPLSLGQIVDDVVACLAE